MHPLLRVVSLLGAVALSSGFAQTGPGPAGHWEGTLQLPDRGIQLVLDLAKDDKGAWTGSFAQPEQSVSSVPLAGLKVDGKGVKFQLAAGGPNAPSFDCTQESAAAMSCAVASTGGTLTAAMKRTGDAKVELPKTSPAVTAELEGNWEGALETPGGSIRIVLHFKNQPDKTVKATMDSPDQGATDLPLSDLVQKGNAVEFQLRLVNGGFKGTFNKESTQIAGEWSQMGNSLPLTLKKAVAK
jgi:hypothetical protein